MSIGYYDHAADFECDDVAEGVLPSDIKRIISHGQHTFHRRLYFFSPSQRQVYRCYPPQCGQLLNSYTIYNSLKYNLITDDGKHDALCVNDKLIARTATMTKLVLPKMK